MDHRVHLPTVGDGICSRLILDDKSAITLPPFRSYRARPALATTQMRIGRLRISLSRHQHVYMGTVRGKVVHVPFKHAD
jgi:hypothetical protein